MKNLKLILTLIVGVTLAFFMGAQIASAFGRPELSNTIGMVLTALALIPKTSEKVAYESLSPDLSAISRYAFKNKIKLLRRYFNAMAIATDITLQPNVKNAMPMPMLVINGQPRPYTGNFKANAKDVSYTDRELKVEKFQRDLIINPSFYANTYLADLRGRGEGSDNMTIPFAQYTLETALSQNAAQLNNKTAFNGLGKSAFSEFNPATAYVKGSKVAFTNGEEDTHYYVSNSATAAGENPFSHKAKWELADALAVTKGIGTMIIEDRGTQLIKNISSTGIITAEDGLEQALSVYRGLPSEVRDNATDIFLYAASDTIDTIADGFKENIMKYTSADGNFIVLPRTDGKCKIKKASWMAGSKMMIATPKSNLYMGTDELSDFNSLKPMEQMYHLELGLTGMIGFQYADEQAISVNDQN